MKHLLPTSLLAIASFFCCTGQLMAHQLNDLVERTIPGYGTRFEFKDIQVEGSQDTFIIESKGDIIVISGNNGVSQASGFNYYLENYCNTQVSLNGFPVLMPKSLPPVEEKVVVKAQHTHRYLFNYCTFGYTTPWWTWERWEKMIDYMAMKGINLPLSIIGQEQVWYDVYKELGLSEAQLDEFFVGPAHLPWGWMGNIDGIGGPLPKTWFQSRVKLQQQILERQRALGMKAVMQAFTGHVPVALKKLYPEADINQINSWAGMEGTQFLSPTDPLFKKIGKMYLQGQTELFGTDHYYDADCFIEVDPPSKDPTFLKNLSKGVYESMSQVDPDAVWVVQAWFLLFRASWWTEQPTHDFFSGVPEGKMMVLDLNAEYNPMWAKCKSFHGHDWIWGVLCGGDQKVNMGSHLQQDQHELERAMAADEQNQLSGIGIIAEGMGYNDPVYDFVFGKNWAPEKVDTQAWIGQWAQRRYHTTDPRAAEAWKLIENTLYNHTRQKWTSILTTPHLIQQSREQDVRIEELQRDIEVSDAADFGLDFDVPRLAKGAEILLSLSDELGDNPSYRFDLVNVFRELVRAFYVKNINNLSRAYASGDLELFDKASADMLRIYQDLEKVTSTQENFMVGPWIESARQWGTTPEEADYYEHNARTIISTWQPSEKPTLRDYASRQWSGMMSDYYIPRWELFIKQLRESIIDKKDFDASAFYAQTAKMDFAWTQDKDKYPTTPQYDTIKVIKELWEGHYKNIFNK